MFISIVILLLWIALLLLILHDVTKHDSRGSVVVLVAKRADLAVRRQARRASRARRQARQAKEAEAKAAEEIAVKAAAEAAEEHPRKIEVAPSTVEEPAASGPLAAEAAPREAGPPQAAEPPEPALQVVMSHQQTPLEITPQEEHGVGKQALGRPRKRKWFSKDSRTEVTGAELEAAIAEAVRKTARCEDFIGVIVGRKIPKSSLDPNWEIQGAKFGKADRKVAEEALANIVERMQKEVVLAGEPEVKAQQRAVVRASL